MRRWLDEVSWQVRGLFASEANRRIGFWGRSLFQASEIHARTEAANELASSLSPDLHVSREAGYLRLPTTAMPDLEAVSEAGRALLAAQVESADRPGGKAFHRNRIAGRDQLEPLLRVALDSRMIAAAASYLGVLPVLGDLDYLLSLPSSRPWSKSQLWHCDDDAPTQLKLFIYCDDVGTDDGPFELVAARDSRRVRSAVGYRYAGPRYRVSDEVMDRHLARELQLSIAGARGSAFVVDTARCFHKGSRIEKAGHHRIAAVVLYCTPNGSKLPLRLAKRPGPFAAMVGDHGGRLERAVLGHPLARGAT